MAPPKLISTGIALGSDSPNCRRLLSPANTSAIRGQLLLNSNSEFETRPADLAAGRSAWGTFQLHQQPVFSWQAGLCESRLSFDARCNDIARFSLSPETVITLDDLLEMSAVSIDPGDARYRQPLCQDARALAGVLRLVPRSCYSAASLAASTSIRCLKLILPLL